MIDWAHERDELIEHDSHDLFRRVDSTDDFLAERAFRHPLDESVDNIEIDVRLQQRGANLAQALANICLGKPPATAKLLQRVAESTLNAFKHGKSRQES